MLKYLSNKEFTLILRVRSNFDLQEGVSYSKLFPIHEPAYLEDSNIEYPVSINGKTRFKFVLPADLTVQQIETEVLDSAEAAKYIAGKEVSKVIVVPKKIINLVIKG